MKQVNYILGLLRITAPKTVKSHKDSLGNRIDVVNIITNPIKLKTTLPKGVNAWDGNINNSTFNSWKKGMHVSRTYSRIQVAPTGIDIVNKNKLVLADQIRY